MNRAHNGIGNGRDKEVLFDMLEQEMCFLWSEWGMQMQKYLPFIDYTKGFAKVKCEELLEMWGTPDLHV